MSLLGSPSSSLARSVGDVGGGHAALGCLCCSRLLLDLGPTVSPTLHDVSSPRVSWKGRMSKMKRPHFVFCSCSALAFSFTYSVSLRPRLHSCSLSAEPWFFGLGWNLCCACTLWPFRFPQPGTRGPSSYSRVTDPKPLRPIPHIPSQLSLQTAFYGFNAALAPFIIDPRPSKDCLAVHARSDPCTIAKVTTRKEQEKGCSINAFWTLGTGEVDIGL